jgi:hypothetical protein
MPQYECNEYQFVENIRRLLESKEKFLVNRKIILHDDAKYGPATMPDQEFKRYETICARKSVNSTVYARVPFVDGFHRGRMHDEGENLHAASALLFPRMSVPYYRVEYSVNVWGGTYFFAFDALFNPEIVIEEDRQEAWQVRRAGPRAEVQSTGGTHTCYKPAKRSHGV